MLYFEERLCQLYSAVKFLDKSKELDKIKEVCVTIKEQNSETDAQSEVNFLIYFVFS